MGLFNLYSTERRLRKSERQDALQATFAKSMNYMASRFNLQKYRFRNYTADQQIIRGYMRSSLGAACISKWEVAYPEPEKKASIGDSEYNDPTLQKLLIAPNKWMTESDWDRFTIKYQMLTGNCYWIKDRGSKYGQMTSMFPFNDMNMTPVGDNNAFIDHFKFVTFDGEVTEYDPEDVIHMPWIYINPFYPNKGIAPGALAALDIDTDTALGKYMASFVGNNAEPGGVITVMKDSPNAAMGIFESTAQKIIESFRKKFSGDGVGLPAMLEPGFDYKIIGSLMKDLDLQNVFAKPEARTCALHLTPPEVVGVNVGMAHSTQNNLAESRIRWTNVGLIPMWKYNQKKFSAGLQKEYPGVKIIYDIENVEAVKEQKQNQLDQKARALLAWIESAGKKSDVNAARAGAEYIFNFTEEQSARMFPTPKITVVTEEGKLQEENV